MKEPKHHPTFALDIDKLETICVDYHNKKHGRTLKRNTAYLYLVYIRNLIDSCKKRSAIRLKMKRILILLRRTGEFRSYILKSVLELNFTVCSPRPSAIKNTFDDK